LLVSRITSQEFTRVRSNDNLESQLLNLPPADPARLAKVLLARLEAESQIESVADVEAEWQQRASGDLRNGGAAWSRAYRLTT
jgi:hypothetical protein